MFSAEGITGKSQWNAHRDKLGISKTYSLNSVGVNGTGYLTSLGRKGYVGSYGSLNESDGKYGWASGSWKMLQTWQLSIHGNEIFGYTGTISFELQKQLSYTATVAGFFGEAVDNTFTKGGIGLFTISQPTRFSDVRIDTVKALTLQEIIERTTWKTDETNIIVNFNNQREDELSTQACVNAFNNKGIHYEQVTTSANESDVNTFLSKIGNRGKYVESTNYNTYMSQLTDYIVTYVRNHI